MLVQRAGTRNLVLHPRSQLGDFPERDGDDRQGRSRSWRARLSARKPHCHDADTRRRRSGQVDRADQGPDRESSARLCGAVVGPNAEAPTLVIGERGRVSAPSFSSETELPR